MIEKNLYQLDELGNKLCTRIFQNTDGVNLQANIHIKRVGAPETEFLGNFFFLESKLVLGEKKKVRIFDGMYVRFEDCIFQHLPFDIESIVFKSDGNYYQMRKELFDFESVYAEPKNDKFTCYKYFPTKLLKPLKSFIF